MKEKYQAARIEIIELEIRVNILEETMRSIIKASADGQEPISVAYARAALEDKQ